MIARIDRALSVVCLALATLAGLCIAAIFVLMVAAVVMRYGVGAPFRFTEELSGLLLVTIVFLTLPYTILADKNIRVSILSSRAKGTMKLVLLVVSECILLAFALIFTWEAYRSTAFTVRFGLASDVARVPLSPFMIVMTGSVALVSAIAVWQVMQAFMRRGLAPAPPTPQSRPNKSAE